MAYNFAYRQLFHNKCCAYYYTILNHHNQNNTRLKLWASLWMRLYMHHWLAIR